MEFQGDFLDLNNGLQEADDGNCSIEGEDSVEEINEGEMRFSDLAIIERAMTDSTTVNIIRCKVFCLSNTQEIVHKSNTGEIQV